MSKQFYTSADYSEDQGERNVVDTLNSWESDNLHIVNFIGMSQIH